MREQLRGQERRDHGVDVSLQRYADLPAKGWYSGDAHIHVTRDEVADPQIWGFVAAEDVYVGNLLEMGNIAKLHFQQPQAWGKASRFERDGHFIVSGQEDPRTGHFGHTIHHNMQSPIRAPSDSYFLYRQGVRGIEAPGRHLRLRAHGLERGRSQHRRRADRAATGSSIVVL